MSIYALRRQLLLHANVSKRSLHLEDKMFVTRPHTGMWVVPFVGLVKHMQFRDIGPVTKLVANAGEYETKLFT